MFYSLQSDFCLRGWEEMAWILVKRPANQIFYLTHEMFQVLLLCDGETELPGNLLDETLFKILEQCEKKGIIQKSEIPSALNSEQYYKYHKNRFVQDVFWSVTGRCNLRCRHCYMDAPEEKLGELSTEEALQLIDQMAECGVLRVDITGGEPFVRKDFWKLVDRILSYQMVIKQIYTNGWLLNGKTLDEFEKKGIKPEINISFDGVGWHDWMRGKEGAEDAALRAISLCCERGFSVSVAMCVHRGNQDTLPETVQRLCEIGVKEIRIANVDMTELWHCNSEGNEMSWREYLDTMIPYISWYYKAGCPIETLKLAGIARMNREGPCESMVRQYNGTESCKKSYLCGSARWSCYITPEGRLLPCMPMTASPQQELFPKVQEIGLQQGLKNSYYMQFVNSRIQNLFEVNQECDVCEYRYQCGGGCRASALLNGDCNLMGCDRDMCVIWKEGYAERIQKEIEAVNIQYKREET